MIRAVADTHAVIWHVFGDSRLSVNMQSFIEQATLAGDQIAFSSITLAEIVYLSERDRIPATTLSDLMRLVDSDRSVWVEIPFDRSIADAMQRVSRAEIPELADRMISATALHLGVPVITRDHKIEASNIATIW
jgi:predicted nucleic acid-binding protein